MISEQKKYEILAFLKPSIDDAKAYYSNHLQSKYIYRQDVIDAEPEFYNTKFKKLSKIPLTTSEVYDTIFWILPSLMDIFDDDFYSIQGENGNDDQRAKKVSQLIKYQTERLNDGWMNRYHWILSALMMNIGFKKKTWQQETEIKPGYAVLDEMQLSSLKMGDDVQYLDPATGEQKTLSGKKIKVKKEQMTSPGDGVSIPALYDVEYEETVIVKNQPLDEIVPVSEVRWNSDARSLKKATFVEHITTRTINDLLEKERQGIYFDIQKVKELVGTQSKTKDQYDQQQREYAKDANYTSDDLRRPVEVHECYVLYDMDGKEKLEPWIFTVAGDCAVLIGAQKNTMGRNHPILELVAMPDTFNVVPRKGIVELLAEIQHINTAMVRLIVRHLITANEGRRFVNKNVVDQDDLINEAVDVGVEGDPRQAVFPMPMTQLSPNTMPFMEYLKTKLRSTIGVSEYNTGTDSKGLNPTATGVTALIDQANKKIKLISQVMAQYFIEDIRFQIALNQQYIDEPQVFRLIDDTIEVYPEDLEGKLDLIVNAGLGSVNKQVEVQNTQLIMQVLEKIAAAYPNMVTPDKAYNLVKLLLEQLGRKDVDQYINNPEFMQQLDAMQAQNMQMQQMLGGITNGGIPGNPSQPPAVPGNDVPTGFKGAGLPLPSLT